MLKVHKEKTLKEITAIFQTGAFFTFFFFFFFTGAVTELFHSADPDLKPLLSTAIQLTLLPDFDSYRWD